MQLENMAGAETTTETDTTSEPTGLQHLGELLAADNAAEASKDTASGSDDTVPTQFNDLAEKLGMELDDLYKLEISKAEDGTPVTIENLKDAHAKQVDISLRELEFEERRTAEEASLMQSQEEIRELLSALPASAIKPEVLEKLRAKHEAQATLERSKTLDVIPEWKDEQTRTSDIEGMVKHLQQYGYPVNHLSHVIDHRQMKYIRDNWQREQRIRRALEKVKAGKPNPTVKQKPANKPPSKSTVTGVKRGNSANKLEALFSEL